MPWTEWMSITTEVCAMCPDATGHRTGTISGSNTNAWSLSKDTITNVSDIKCPMQEAMPLTILTINWRTAHLTPPGGFTSFTTAVQPGRAKGISSYSRAPIIRALGISLLSQGFMTTMCKSSNKIPARVILPASICPWYTQKENGKLMLANSVDGWG